MNNHIIIHASVETGEYFFSTDHCQENHAPETYPSEKGFVPCTFSLPMRVAARPSLPSGIISTRTELITVFHWHDREISNPDPRYQG